MKTIDDLQIGDDILVKYYDYNDWIKKIFIKKGKDDTIICCNMCDEERFLSGKSFNTEMFNIYKIPQEPEYIPFDFSDAAELICRPVIDIHIGNYNLIRIVTDSGVSVNDSFYYFDELLAIFTFTDGSPCGKLKGVE
jgi:hypothetical protein